jgi:3-hydroxyacyl-CoA dehydrogenase/enoyl-CoA hydratase/3-hydroxybutyryl-CoA epimerase
MTLSRRVTPDGACILTFERRGWSRGPCERATLDDLEQHLAAVASARDLRGVILASAGDEVTLREDGAEDCAWPETIDRGQRISKLLAALTVPTVAAIRGPCTGGELELALACDWRVASLERATLFSFPQTQRGLIPAWGGCTRTPQLIGLPAALDAIVTGRGVRSREARALGLIDELTHSEYLHDVARTLIARGKRPAPAPRWRNTVPFSLLVAAHARWRLRRRTRGHCAAQLAAIHVCTAAAAAPVDDGFAREKAALLELLRSRETQNLLEVFREEDAAIGPSARPEVPAPAPVRRVAIAGANALAGGIAHAVSAGGTPVILQDGNPAALARALHEIESVYAKQVAEDYLTGAEAKAAMDRIFAAHTRVPLREVDLVIETAPEALTAKQQALREFEPRVAAGTTFASTASGLSVAAIAAGLPRPERVVGMHFFAPVHRSELVEIVRAPRTAPAAVATAREFVRSLGKRPLVVRDSPGFLVHRILLPCLLEAVWMFTEGTSVRTIDRVVEDFGFPVGPLRLADDMGLDTVHRLAKDLARRLPSAIPLSDTLERMLAQGWHGKSSGRGFYVHRGERARPASGLRTLQASQPRTRDEALQRDRLVLIMVNEAARTLDERVVDTPEDVDRGMIFGAGWPAFRGGPLRYADSRGIGDIIRRLEALTLDIAPHFAPCESLCAMAEAGRSFYTGRARSRPSLAGSTAASLANPTSTTSPAVAPTPSLPLYPDGILAD